MTKRYFIFILVLLLTPLLVLAQDEEVEAEEIAYLQLKSNFSVLEIPDWELTTGDETVLFSRDDIQAQIYVRVVETLDTSEAIAVAIADVELITEETTEPILEGRIGLSNGTWNYSIFNEGDTSVTAYALVKSQQVYVVLFAEESPDYEAYHLAIRSSINAPITLDEINEAINPVAVQAFTSLIDANFTGEALATERPIEDNSYYIEASFENDVMTASYLVDGIVYVTLVRGDVDLVADLSDSFDLVFVGFVITPDNIEFLWLGLAFSGTIMLLLIASMFLRYQNIKKDLLVVEQLAEE